MSKPFIKEALQAISLSLGEDSPATASAAMRSKPSAVEDVLTTGDIWIGPEFGQFW